MILEKHYGSTWSHDLTYNNSTLGFSIKIDVLVFFSSLWQNRNTYSTFFSRLWW